MTPQNRKSFSFNCPPPVTLHSAWLLAVLYSLMLLFQPGLSFGQDSKIQARLTFDKVVFQPAADEASAVGRIGILLKIAPGWHTYWKNSGEAALSPKISWQLPQGWRVGELEWPVPYRFMERGKITTYGYKNEVLLIAPVYAPNVIPEKDEHPIFRAKVSYLVCNEICVPGSAEVEREITFSASLGEQASADFSLFSSYEKQTPTSLDTFNERFRSGKTPITATLSLANEKDGIALSVELNNLGTRAKDFIAGAQLFPLRQTPFKPLPPFVARLGKKPEGSVVFQMKYSRPKPAKEIPQTGVQTAPLEGLLAIKSSLLQTGTSEDSPIAFTWVAPSESIESALMATQIATPPENPGIITLDYRTEDRTPLAAAPSTASTTLPAGKEVQNVDAQQPMGLALALVLAFLGGLILNLMPCVLPIISIKVMSFVSASGKSRRDTIISSVFFTLGILCSMYTLAGIIISLRSLGFSLGWGFQFQYPSFVFFLTIIIFVLGLSFFELYSIRLPGLNRANKFATALRSPATQSFFDGVLATALSTPCTAPLLGTALVFAFSQPPIATLLVFTAIALGLAFPYTLFAAVPSFAKILPKPGAWMFRFRQFLGFMLLGTVVWLMFILHALTNVGALWAAVFLLIVFFCLWLIRGFGDEKVSPGPVRLALSLFLLGISLLWITPRVLHGDKIDKHKASAIGWQDFSAEALEKALNSEQTVFIDFTATWCVTCKTNEFLVIETDETMQELKRRNILPLKADWTSGDEQITAALKRYGAEGVPLYVVDGPGEKPAIVLSGIISKSSLYRAFENAAQTK